MKLILLAALLLTLFVSTPVEAKQVRGTVNTTLNWAYMDFFVYGQGPVDNLITWRITLDKALPNALMTLWDDQPDSWPSVYGKGLTCQQMKAKALAKSGRAMPISSGQTVTTSIGDPANNRYWYFMFLDCEDVGPFNFKYNLHMVNSNTPKGTGEFSLNDLDFAGISGTFLGISLVVLLVALYMLKTSLKTAFFHPLHGLVVTMIVLIVLYHLCLVIHWSTYAQDGQGSVGLLATGELLEFGAEMLIMLVFIMMAYGWTINSPSAPTLRGFYCSLITIATVLIFLFFMMHLTTNTAVSAYAYESVSGVLILMIRLILLVLFIYKIRISWKNEETRRTVTIFFWIAIIGTLWFISMPIFVLFGEALAGFERNKFVCSLRYIVDLSLILGACVCLLPRWCERFFKLEPDAGPDTRAARGEYGATSGANDSSGYANLPDSLPSHTGVAALPGDMI